MKEKDIEFLKKHKIIKMVCEYGYNRGYNLSPRKVYRAMNEISRKAFTVGSLSALLIAGGVLGNQKLEEHIEKCNEQQITLDGKFSYTGIRFMDSKKLEDIFSEANGLSNLIIGKNSAITVQDWVKFPLEYEKRVYNTRDELIESLGYDVDSSNFSYIRDRLKQMEENKEKEISFNQPSGNTTFEDFFEEAESLNMKIKKCAYNTDNGTVDFCTVEVTQEDGSTETREYNLADNSYVVIESTSELVNA